MTARPGNTRWAYSGLPSRPAGRWPGGAGLAVYVCVGLESYRFGDGHAEDILPGVTPPDLVNTAWRDYGNRVGAFRLFDRLAAHGIAPTVLLNTDVYDEAPDVLGAARAAGAEIVGHGVSNSDSLAGAAPDHERAYLRRVAEAVAAAEGAPPGGWSGPWLAHTPTTIDSLAATGYRYLLDLRFDDQPVWLTTAAASDSAPAPAPILAIPYSAELNDSSTVVGRQATATEFAEMIVDEFDEQLIAAREQPLVMSIVLHSFISGVPFRLRALTRALAHIAAAGAGVWLTQPRHIHAAVVAAPEVFGRAEVVR